MKYWLFKSEPDVYAWADLVSEGRTEWEGVRNYQARNLMRDEMRVGDLVFYYHSNAKPQVIAGIARIVREAYPDHHARDPASHYHDPKATADNPIWLMVDLEPVQAIEPPITRDELKTVPELAGMMLLKRGSRLSVQPVTPADWRTVLALRGLADEPSTAGAD
jgi:predicted RNA-binding protein with PUA-like domain